MMTSWRGGKRYFNILFGNPLLTNGFVLLKMYFCFLSRLPSPYAGVAQRLVRLPSKHNTRVQLPSPALDAPPALLSPITLKIQSKTAKIAVF